MTSKILISIFFTMPCLALIDADFSYISNKKIKIGVIKNYGAIIGYFSKMPNGKNLINTHDAGREIQQSYYMEETITLDDDIARIKFKFSYFGTNNYAPIHQELPAVFVDAEYDTLVFYSGKKLWVNDKLTKKIPKFPNEEICSYENWNAYVKNDYGIGVYTPGTDRVTCYRYLRDSTNKPIDLSCSYFAPVRTMAISSNFVYEYDVYLTIGKIEEIRARFYKIHKK